MEDQQLKKSIQQCTVRIHTNSGVLCTGFFVAAGLILTCAHGVKTETSNLIKIYWKEKDQEYPAEVWDFSKTFDLAILKLTSEVELEHPCVTFDSAKLETNILLYSFGYSSSYFKGDDFTCNYEGSGTKKDDSTLHKLKKGQFEEGFSGSPLVSFSTGNVCGVVCISRHENTDLGGRAVPTETVLSVFPDLKGLNFQSHEKDKFQSILRWILNLNFNEDGYDSKHPLAEYFRKAGEWILRSYKINSKIDNSCRASLGAIRDSLKLPLDETTEINKIIEKIYDESIENTQLCYESYQKTIDIYYQDKPNYDVMLSKNIRELEKTLGLSKKIAGCFLTRSGYESLETGDIKIAVSKFKEAIKRNPKCALSYRLLIISLIRAVSF